MDDPQYGQLIGIINTVIFFLIFVGFIIYAFWPGNQKNFQDAADIPLREDE